MKNVDELTTEEQNGLKPAPIWEQFIYSKTTMIVALIIFIIGMWLLFNVIRNI